MQSVISFRSRGMYVQTNILPIPLTVCNYFITIAVCLL